MAFKHLDWTLLGRLFPYLRRRAGMISLTLLLMLTFNGLTVLSPYLVKLGIDGHVVRGDWEGLVRLCWVLGLVLVGAFVTQAAFSVLAQYLGQKLLFDLRMDLFRKVLALSRDYFDRTPVGRTLTNVTNDVEAIREFISEGIVTVIGELLKVVLISAAMLLVNYRLALLSFITLPLFITATAMFRKSIRTGFQGVRRANAEINTSLNETITGIREIKLFNVQEQSERRFSGHNRQYLSAYLKTVRSYALYFPVLEIVSNLSMVIILMYSHYGLGTTLEVGEVFAFFAYVNMFFMPLRQLAEKFNLFQSAMAASERIFRLMDEPVTIASPDTPTPLPESRTGEIRFEKVSFCYTDDTPVLKNISFTIRSGETVALVGHTGSGKSTVIRLLGRLYDVTAGRILMDGVDVRHLDLTELRESIAYVPQDLFLFTGSLADNISLHRPGVDRDRVENAIARVYLDRTVSRLPNGLDENVLEEGKLLSAGEKQLLSFARALIKKPTVVVLDEATSNIDSETESLVEQAVEELMTGTTAIIIAHRLSTIRSADRILVLHNGELVEEGTHATLMARGGRYSDLYRMQSLMAN